MKAGGFECDFNAKGEDAALAELLKHGMQIVEKNGDELLKAVDALR